MKNLFKSMLLMTAVIAASCNSGESNKETQTETETTSNSNAGQSAVKDDESSKNIVQVASGSADHTTLVTAVKAAELVDVLSNTGPFTVFAPTNEAFNKLPAGTVDDLLKPENKDALSNILEYHVSLAVYKPEAFTDGQTIGQVNGGSIKINKKDGKIFVNDKAEIIASIPTSNGIIHVINEVLTPSK
jgi:uncharacterized surface protein with fasciclin (FAS1) repeats